MAASKNKPLMRSLGEFFGHVIQGIRTDPAKPQTTVLKKEIKEEDRGDVILRRTTIEEIEVKSRTEPKGRPNAGDDPRPERSGTPDR